MSGAPHAVASFHEPTTTHAIDWLVVAWVAGALLVLARFGIGVVLVWRALRSSTPAPTWDGAQKVVERQLGRRVGVRQSRVAGPISADEHVVRAGIRGSTYAAHLVEIASTAPASAIAMGEGPLSKRVAAIVADRPRALDATAIASLVVVATLLVAACSVGVTASPASDVARTARSSRLAPR